MDRDDSMLVKIKRYVDDTEELLAMYHTVAIDETLKMFITAKKYDVPCGFGEFDESIPKDIRNIEFTVIAVWLNLGSKMGIPAIEVIIE